MTPKQKIKIVQRLNLIWQKSEEEGIYKTHPLQHYLLDADEKGTEINLLWRTCSIQKQKSKNIVTKSDKNEQKHIGEYWYEIRTTIPYHEFRKIESRVVAYFKSLKDLKRGINAKFVEYGFLEQYKVKLKGNVGETKMKCLIEGCENETEAICIPLISSNVYCKKHFEEVYQNEKKRYTK